MNAPEVRPLRPAIRAGSAGRFGREPRFPGRAPLAGSAARFGGVLALALLAGCARQAGGRAASGAMDTVREKVQQGAPPEQSPVEIVAGRAVDGALDRLTAPEHVAALRRLIEEAAAGAVASALHAAGDPQAGEDDGRLDRLATRAATAVRTALAAGLVEDLGPQGRGPLGHSFAATVGSATGSATDAALARLDCEPGDARCLDRRLAEISQSAANGFLRGVRDSLGVGLLILAFLAGAAAATIVSLGIALARRPRPPTPVADRPRDWAVKPG